MINLLALPHIRHKRHKRHQSKSKKVIRAIIVTTYKQMDLLRLGSDKSEISQLLKLHPHTVATEIGRIEKEAKETRRFLATGQISRGDGGYYAILQR